MPVLTKRLLDSAQPRTKDYFLFCSRLPHFGARIHPTGRKVFVAQVRVGRRRIRRVKIGPYGPFTLDQARERAGEIIRAAAEGRDPQREKQAVREAITVAELCDA
jgi:Arm domain-containing DNA-binding protein